MPVVTTSSVSPTPTPTSKSVTPLRQKPKTMSMEWQTISFRDDEMEEIKATFGEFDKDGNGSITADELKEVFKSLGEDVPGYKIRDMIAESDSDNSGTIDFEEFLNMMKKARASSGKGVGQLYKVAGKVSKNIKKLGGQSAASSADTAHSYSEEEAMAFADWINYALGDDSELKSYLPIDVSGANGSMKLFKTVKDGVVLAKLINSAVADTIDERVLNKTQLNAFKIGENQTLVVHSAAAIGVNTTNIGPNDLMAGNPTLTLGVLWQIIRIGLFAQISIQQCPGLARLLMEGEELKDLLALNPEALLLRWVNFHLENANAGFEIKNFGSDISDSRAYVYLLSEIAPRELGIDTSALEITDDTLRAEAVLESAEKMDCRKFVTAKNIVSGNPKLNLAFVAHLFNQYPGLEAEEGVEIDESGIVETREEKTFRNWMNSLGVKPFVYNFYSDLGDGWVLLQLIDKVKPGIVNWSKVNKPPFKKFGGHMLKIENCNYAIQLGKELRLSLVGIGGQDIYHGVQKLILGFAWQLMRAYTIKILQKLSGSDAPVSDQQVVAMINERLTAVGKQQITGLTDPYIATSQPILDLVNVIKPGVVRSDLVMAGDDEESRMANAKYAITLARKVGAGVYALPEDIVEVKGKMLLTIFACLQGRMMEQDAKTSKKGEEC